MGKERDALIRRLGGTPVDEFKLSEEKILELAWDTYIKKGEIPPYIQALIDEIGIEKKDGKNRRLKK
jgi:hypothetical protein